MKAKKNQVKLTMAIIGALMLISVFGAQAATLVKNPDNDAAAIGIRNLAVGDYLFNVTWVYDNSERAYGALPPFEMYPEELF